MLGSCVCASPSTAYRIESPVTGRVFAISHRQKDALEVSWLKISDKTSLGKDIFFHIFMTKPSLKRLWGLEKESLDQLESNALFLKHSGSFVTFLDMAVRSLSLNGGYLIRLARTVGKRHVLFKEVSFDAEYWLLFKSAVMAALETRITAPELRKAWHQLVMFLVAEVKDAFNSEIKTRHSSVVTVNGVFGDVNQNDLAKLVENISCSSSSGPSTRSSTSSFGESSESTQLVSSVRSPGISRLARFSNSPLLTKQSKGIWRKESKAKLNQDLIHIMECVMEEEDYEKDMRI